METPALWQYLGAYLHQDWYLEFDEWAASDAFINDSQALASQLPAEIEVVLSTYSRDSDVKRFLDSQGCNFLPDGKDYRGWLTQISRRAAAATAH